MSFQSQEEDALGTGDSGVRKISQPEGSEVMGCSRDFSFTCVCECRNLTAFRRRIHNTSEGHAWTNLRKMNYP